MAKTDPAAGDGGAHAAAKARELELLAAELDAEDDLRRAASDPLYVNPEAAFTLRLTQAQLIPTLRWLDERYGASFGRDEAEEVAQEWLTFASERRLTMTHGALAAMADSPFSLLGPYCEALLDEQRARDARARGPAAAPSPHAAADGGPASEQAPAGASGPLLYDALSPRQRAIVDLIRNGTHGDKEIAAALGIKPAGVRAHRRRLSAKLTQKLQRRVEEDPRPLDPRDGQALPARPARPYGRGRGAHGPRHGSLRLVATRNSNAC